MEKKVIRLSEGELAQNFENELKEAIDLDKNDVRTVRGKYRGYGQVYADYHEESDGTLKFMGYSVKQSFTDFTSEVNKTADRAIDFGHFYHVRREYKHMADDEFESDIREKYVVPNPDYKDGDPRDTKYLIDMVKVGATGHLEKTLYTYAEFSRYVGELYRQEQAILKEIASIPVDKYKGNATDRYGQDLTPYATSEQEAETAATIRSGAKPFTGAEEDWAEVDLVTEIELMLVDMFDSIDNITCNDATKMDIVRFAADKVAKKRLGTSSPLAHRATARGSGNLKMKPQRTTVALALIKDMKNYTIDKLDKLENDDAEYFTDLAALRKSMNQKDSEDDYAIEGEGAVIPRVATAKKRGDGYTTFKKMSSKYKDAHKAEIDDEDW